MLDSHNHKRRREDERKILHGLDALKQGRILLVNTDTVPGIAVSPFLPQAVNKIYRLKGRTWDKPLVWMVADFRILADMLEVSSFAENLIQQYWPGALTLIFRVKNQSHPYYNFLSEKPNFKGDNKLSLAVRIPSGDRYLFRLLERSSKPLAVTSVNRSGKDELRTWEAIRSEFGESLDYSFYPNQETFCEGNIGDSHPSTVIDVRTKPEIIRRGHVQVDHLL